MTHATDIVAYTYEADIYCPPCIAKMFKDDLDDSENIAPYATTEQILELVAAQREVDYSDPYSYDFDNFPKVVFSSQANDADYNHCANMHDKKFTEVCEGHIDHDLSDCAKWRGIEEHDDFSGRFIMWTSPGNEFVLEMTRVYPPTKPDEFHKNQWSYKLFDYEWYKSHGEGVTSLLPDGHVPIFDSDEFWSPDFNEAPEIVSAILGFLSLQPGDTDSEYFDNYTERQIAWRDERAEELSFTRMEQFDE